MRIILFMPGLFSLMCSVSIHSAGLVFSDEPMFVADVVRPNVIISPAYLNDYAEAVMKDLPLADTIVRPEFNGTIFEGGSQRSILEYVANDVYPDSAWVVSNFSDAVSRGVLRVTPWPGEVKIDNGLVEECSGAATVPNCPKLVVGDNGIGYACSNIELYAGDITVLANPKIKNMPMGFQISNACKYAGAVPFVNAFPGVPSRVFGLVQEIYPQVTIPVSEVRYDVAKSRYARSDSNFLYFNESTAAAGVYEPWRSLGGAEFTKYTANKAAYSPFASRSAAGEVFLDQVMDNWMTLPSGNNRDNPKEAVNYPAYVGQYWKKSTDSLVVLPDSYDGYCWTDDTYTDGIGCSGVINDLNKVAFANWFTYWRSSGLATRGMLGLLFDRLRQSDLLDKFRFAFTGRESVTGNKVIKPEIGFYAMDARYELNLGDGDTPAARKISRESALLADIRGKIYDENFLLNDAWNYVKTHDKLRQPESYLENGVSIGCRRNYEILITPDYSGLTYISQARFPMPADTSNLDGVDGNENKPPYPDQYGGMWSDVGAEGWRTDLSDLANNLLPATTNPATHQHVVRYLIGPSVAVAGPGDGEFNNLFPANVLSYSEATSIATAATSSGRWPAKPAASDLERLEFGLTYDDLWHMALNSHGYYYTSNNVSESVDNLLRAFNEILARNISGSSVATNTTSLQQGSLIYQATVETGYRGHLRAFGVESNDAGTALEINYSSPVWDLASKVTAQADAGTRKVITAWNGVGTAFTWDTLGATAKGLLLAEHAPAPALSADSAATDSYGQKLVSYLRGDGTCEDGSNTVCTYTNTSNANVSFVFRRRNLQKGNTTPYSLDNPNGRNVLGDVANSNPWLVTAPVIGPSDVDSPGYNHHRNSYAARKSVLYVGANDGMLHAVDASTATDLRGKELFAFIPSFVYQNLHELASTGYDHLYFVDGSPFSAEVDIVSGAWKTVLAGGVNKGGKGYYMLDITEPETITEGTAATKVLWEFDSGDDADLHYTFNMPVPMANGQARQIRKMKNGQWAMFVGNGYPDANNKRACLFVIYLSGPSSGVWTPNVNYLKSCVGKGVNEDDDDDEVGDELNYFNDGGNITNGMSTPNPVDEDGDGAVDRVYVGDINGNLWRFDLSVNGGVNVVTPAFSGTPLFVAKQGSLRQPIVAPPEVSRFTSGSKSGNLILFGTGKFIETTDSSNSDVQSFYAVWDREWSGLEPSDLLERTLVENGTQRTQSTSATLYYCDTVEEGADKSDCVPEVVVAPEDEDGPVDDEVEPVKYLGWFWNMPTAGERLTGRVNLINDAVMFNTFFPSLDPCEYGGDGWLMGFNAITGLQESIAIFDMDQDGTVEPTEVGAGFKVGAAIGGTTFARGIAGKRQGIYSPTNLGTHADEGRKMTLVVNSGDNTTGRVSWYELMD